MSPSLSGEGLQAVNLNLLCSEYAMWSVQGLGVQWKKLLCLLVTNRYPVKYGRASLSLRHLEFVLQLLCSSFSILISVILNLIASGELAGSVRYLSVICSTPTHAPNVEIPSAGGPYDLTMK